MSGSYEQSEWWPGSQTITLSEVPPCSRVPVAAFQQDKIWADGKGKTWDIHEIENGHLDNIIRWIGAHSEHWSHPVLVSPLMRELEAEQKRRLPTRAKTGRAALKDVLMNDQIEYQTYVAPSKKIDQVVSKILAGLRRRGYDVTRISERKNT